MRCRMLVLIAAAACVAGQPYDKARLRSVLPFPSFLDFAEDLDLGWRDADVCRFPGRDVFYLPEARKAVQGQPNDPDRWLALAELCDDQQDKIAREARHNALALYRKQLESRPNEGRIMSRAAACLVDASDRAEAERLFRGAVLKSPENDECWGRLGEFLIKRVIQRLHETSHSRKFGERQGDRSAAVRESGLSTMRENLNLIEEARQCYDRSVAAGPETVENYLRRATFRVREAVALQVLKSPQSESFADPRPADLVRVMSPDVERAGVMRPDDPWIIGIAPLVELSAEVSSLGVLSKTFRALETMSPDRQSKVRRSLERLESFAKNGSTDSAAWVLAYLAMISKDWRRAEEYADRVLQSNPDFEPAEQLRCVALRRSGREAELLAFAQDRLRLKDTMRRRCMLAGVYHAAGRDDAAASIVEIGLSRNPDDFRGNLILAALLLRRDDDRSLTRAGILMDRVEVLSRLTGPTKDDSIVFTCMKLSRAALEDRYDIVRTLDKEIHKAPMYRDDDRVQRIQKVVGDVENLPSPPLLLGRSLELPGRAIGDSLGEEHPRNSSSGISTAKAARLRKAIGTPAMAAKFALKTNSNGVTSLDGYLDLLNDQVTALETSVRKNPMDPLLWSKLSDGCSDADQFDKAEVAAARAAALSSDRTQQVHLRARLSACRAASMPSDTIQEIEASEQLRREAVRLDPSAWRNWTELGTCLKEKAVAHLCGEEYPGSVEAATTLARRALAGRITEEDEARARACDIESIECYEKAATVAPRDAKRSALPSLCRIDVLLRPVSHRGNRGVTRDPGLSISVEDCLTGLWRATAVDSSDLRIAATAAYFEMTLRFPSGQAPADVDLVQNLSPRSRAAVDDVFDRLKRAAQNRGVEGAEAAFLLNFLFALRCDWEQQDHYLALAVRLAPQCDRMWDCRVAGLMKRRKIPEALAVAREYFKQKDCSHTRCVLAKMCFVNGDPLEAEQLIETALEREPGDLMNNFMLAALLLRKDDQKVLSRVGGLIDRAMKVLPDDAEPLDTVNLALIRIAYVALSESASQALDLVRSLPPAVQNDERVAALVKILEEPDPTPAR